MADRITFGRFSLDPDACELHRGLRLVKMERLPMELLLLLLSRRGSVVSRNEIVERLWGKDVYLDVESSVNTVIRKLRRALGDSAQNPKFVLTMPGRGYRFVARVDEENAPAKSRRLVVAVLPFENLSSDPAQDYFCDGMTEETIAGLGAASPDELAIIARTSAMRYKKTSKTIRQIGKELGADFILESSIRKEANHVRVTTQLIRAQDQIHQWAHSYDRDASSLIGLQTELGRDIAEQIKAKLSSPHTIRQQTLNPEAFDLYLKGRFQFASRTGEAITAAIRYYEQALAVDPHYSLAKAGIADAYATLPITSDWRTADCLAKGMLAAQQAVFGNEFSAETHTSLAACCFWLSDDWNGAIREAQRAIELNPSYALAHFYLAHTYSNLARHDQAEAAIGRALALDPFSVHLHAIHGQLLFQAGRYEDSARAARRACELNPNAWLGHHILGKTRLEAGDYDQAVREFKTAIGCSGGNTEPLSLKIFALARSGYREQALAIMTEMEKLCQGRYVPPYNLAMAMNGLNRPAEAFSFLQRAAKENDVRLKFLAFDPKWKEMNRDARVRALWPKPQREHLEESAAGKRAAAF
jgi:TolB-like protein/Flp pilus assembly protein TadD